MPTAQMDFHISIDRTGALCAETLCSARAAGGRPLPAPHRRKLTSVTRRLELAQQDLYELRNDPWAPAPQKRQLELL
jgi:hypothetical protein